jgi:hypothetical protein
LAVWTIVSALDRAFIRRDAQPLEALNDLLFRSRYEAFLVSVFDAENELAAGFASK